MQRDKILRWRNWDGAGLEHLVIRRSGGDITAESAVIAGDGFAVIYKLRCEPEWRVRRIEVAVVGGGRSVLLETDGKGRWTIDGKAAPELDGALEPDLSVSPLTNTMPIRRLELSVGESADIRTAYVSFPDLKVFADPQRYTCLEKGRLYRYESLDSDFRRDIEVDADGFVVIYPGLFRRVA